MHLNDLLKNAVTSGASDLHLKVGSYPMMRVNGVLVVASEEKRLDRADTETIASGLFTPDLQERFKRAQEVDLAYSVPGLGRFLLGRFFYSDAVNTVIVVMSVVASKAKGLSPTYTNLLLLSLTVVAVIASFLWGRMVDRSGPKRTLVAVLISWAVGLTLGVISLSISGVAGLALFAFAGAILGSGLGGVQVSDRVLMVRLAPPARIGEFFGLYGLVGKGSQVIGQLLYGLIIGLFLVEGQNGAYQLAVLSLLGTMLVGLWLLRGVSDRWEGSGEIAADEIVAPPERLAPALAPLEPR